MGNNNSTPTPSITIEKTPIENLQNTNPCNKTLDNLSYPEKPPEGSTGDILNKQDDISQQQRSAIFREARKISETLEKEKKGMIYSNKLQTDDETVNEIDLVNNEIEFSLSTFERDCCLHSKQLAEYVLGHLESKRRGQEEGFKPPLDNSNGHFEPRELALISEEPNGNYIPNGGFSGQENGLLKPDGQFDPQYSRSGIYDVELKRSGLYKKISRLPLPPSSSTRSINKDNDIITEMGFEPIEGHRGSNQSSAVKRPVVRRASAPGGQILADHINQRSPKKTPLSSTGSKQGGYGLSTPPRCESPVSGRSGKRSSCRTSSSAECSQHSSTENLHHRTTPCGSPAKHASKMLPPSTVGKTPTSPAKRAASPASTSSLASSSLRSSASSSLSASSEKLNSSESKSSGGRLDMDQISTMTLEQFKNLLNNQLITTAKEQAPNQIDTNSRLTRQKGGEIGGGSSSNKLQNPSTKNFTTNGQARGLKQTPIGKSADHSPDISRRMRSPSPNLYNQSGENAGPEGPSSGLKPRGKSSGLSFLPRPNMGSQTQLNGQSKLPMKRSGGSAIPQVPRPVTPSGETKAQRSLPTTPKQERKYTRNLPPRQLTEGSNIGKQISSSMKRAVIMQRATTPGPRSKTPTKLETRRSSTPGLRELQVFSDSGNANLTDDTQSSADEESGGLKTPTPGRRGSSRSQSGLSSRSSSTHSLNLAVKGDIPIEEPRMISHPGSYAERWRRNKRSASAVRGGTNSSTPDLITVSRTQTGGHSVLMGKPSASEVRSGLGQPSKSDLSKDTTDAMRRARSIARNATSKIARSQSADRFSERQRSNSISSVEDNGDMQWSKDRPQQRRLSELGNKTSTAVRSNSLKYERSIRPRRGGSVTPNSIDICDVDLSSRPLEEIEAALIPVNGIVPQVSDPNELDAPPEDPEMYEQMEKLFEAYRQKELRDMVEATDRSKDSLTITLDRQDDDDDSRGGNTDLSSLDSNANLPISGQSSLAGSRRSSIQRTSDAESVEKVPGALKEQNKSQGSGSRIPTSRIPAPRTCRIPAPKSKIGSGSGIPKSGHQKNGVKMYSMDYPDDNSASPSDCHEYLTSDQVSDNSRRTSYSDESSISTSDTSTNNVGQRLETPVPKVAKPLTTGRQRLIRPEIRVDKSKLVKAVSDKNVSHYGQKYLHDDEDEDETF